MTAIGVPAVAWADCDPCGLRSAAAEVPPDATTAQADALAPAPLPAFPYLDWPESVPADAREVAREATLDAVTVIAGEQLLLTTASARRGSRGTARCRPA
jgi:hypothetical protein